MGVKKSTVWTRASSAEILYTPASSALSKPTRTFGSCCRANFPSTRSSAAGLSLEAQPAAFTASVRRVGLLEDIEVILLAEVPKCGIAGVYRDCHSERSEESAVRRQREQLQIPRCARNDNSDGADRFGSPKIALSRFHARHLHLRIRAVPIAGDVLEREAKRPRLAGGERQQVEVNRVLISGPLFQHHEGGALLLYYLVERILERHFDDGVRHGFAAGVRHFAFQVGNGGADKVLRRRHFYVGEFDLLGVWTRHDLRRARLGEDVDRGD